MSVATNHPQTGRLQSLDVMRGIVMVLMAIDHVRVYSGVPAGGPTPAIFFTRWITHFVARAFLAGTAAFLHGRKLADRGGLARYLVTRGAFLVLLELTVIRMAWTLNFDYALHPGRRHLGARRLHGSSCGADMASDERDRSRRADRDLRPRFVRTRRRWLAAVDGAILYFGGEVQLGSTGPTLAVLYSIVPWDWRDGRRPEAARSALAKSEGARSSHRGLVSILPRAPRR